MLPQEDLIYLGDTARVPYGTKSAATVTRYSVQNVRFLLEQKVKMVVVACNTASAFSLEELRKQYPVPIVGVIEPGAKGALQATRSGRIGVIGTEGTVKSEAYAQSLVSRDPKVFVASTPCPLFVPLVEEGWLTGEVTERIAQEYLQKPLAQKIDTLILGCTHYPLLKPTLQKVAGNEVALIDSAEETAKEVALLLAQKGLMRLMRRENKMPRRDFYVTDSPERFRRVGEIFLKNPFKNIHHVTIEA